MPFLPLAEVASRYAFPFLQGNADTPAGRHELYDTLDFLYHNTLFEQMGLAALDPELAKNAATATVRGIYNPASRIVDAYREYTLAGTLGPEDDDTADVHIRAGNPAIVGPLLNIWRWSNMESEKQLIPYYGANLGDVLLMAVVRPAVGSVPGKVWLEVRHPGIIKDVRFDSRGNIAYARIEQVKENVLTVDDVMREIRGELAAAEPTYLYTAIYTKEKFATLKDGRPHDYTGSGAPAIWDNPWGFVPLVLVQHKPSGGDWGLNAYHSSIPAIMESCLDASVCGQLLGQWLTPQWAVFGVGRSQQKIRRDGPAWLFDEKGDAKALVADVDFDGAYTHIERMLKDIAEKQPELSIARAMEANLQTGAAIRAMLFDFVRRAEMAQDQYDAGLVRGLQMCLTLGANADGLGTALDGFGELGGTYESGAFAFGFDRPDILAPSKLEQAQADAEMASLQRQRTATESGVQPGASDGDAAAAALASRLLNGAATTL